MCAACRLVADASAGISAGLSDLVDSLDSEDDSESDEAWEEWLRKIELQRQYLRNRGISNMRKGYGKGGNSDMAKGNSKGGDKAPDPEEANKDTTKGNKGNKTEKQ